MRYQADSRLIEKGDIFFALPGAKTDGLHFLEEARNRGAQAAYVPKSYTGPDFGLSLIPVDDPLKTLQEMAKIHLSRFKGKVIGVTGSIGKTTTKEFIAQLLSTKYRVAASKKSQNTKITLPLTLLNEVQLDDDFAVLEMGMTHPGDIGKLVAIAPPDIAVLTQVALVHAVNFSSIEEIYRNKCAIFSSPRTKVKLYPDAFELPSQMAAAFTLPGAHNLKNLASAVGACLAAGMTESEIVKAIPYLHLPERRLELVRKKGVSFLNDSYNACWLSMQGAMDTFKEMPGRKLAVFGDMKEQGSLSQLMHQKVLDYAFPFIEKIFLLGPEWKTLANHPKCTHFMDKQELFLHLKRCAAGGDSILVKGSNSHQLWTIPEEF